MFKDRILHSELSWIAGEGGQRLGGRGADPIRIRVVFGRSLLQQAEDLVLSQLLMSCSLYVIVGHRLILPPSAGFGQVLS